MFQHLNVRVFVSFRLRYFYISVLFLFFSSYLLQATLEKNNRAARVIQHCYDLHEKRKTLKLLGSLNAVAGKLKIPLISEKEVQEKLLKMLRQEKDTTLKKINSLAQMVQKIAPRNLSIIMRSLADYFVYHLDKLKDVSSFDPVLLNSVAHRFQELFISSSLQCQNKNKAIAVWYTALKYPSNKKALAHAMKSQDDRICDYIREEFSLRNAGQYIDDKKTTFSLRDLKWRKVIQKALCDAEASGWRELILSDNKLISTIHDLQCLHPNINLIEKLTITGTNLGKINARDLKNFFMLKEINLSNNQITHIETGSFDGISSDAKINLKGNPLWLSSGAMAKNIAAILSCKKKVDIKISDLPQEECQICYDDSNAMKTLACGHQICCQCLARLTSTSSNFKQSPLYTCPFCKQRCIVFI